MKAEDTAFVAIQFWCDDPDGTDEDLRSIIAAAIREAENEAVENYLAGSEKAAFPPIEEARALFDYDAETGVISYRYVWGKRPAGAPATRKRKDKYLEVIIRKFPFNRIVKAHRLAWYLATGEDPGSFEVDHINGDRSDNRLVNLRLATRGQNQINWVRRKSSGLPVGVTFKNDSKSKPYVAKIKRGGINKYLGRFATPEEASAAFREAAALIDSEYTPSALKHKDI